MAGPQNVVLLLVPLNNYAVRRPAAYFSKSAIVIIAQQPVATLPRLRDMHEADEQARQEAFSAGFSYSRVGYFRRAKS